MKLVLRVGLSGSVSGVILQLRLQACSVWPGRCGAGRAAVPGRNVYLYSVYDVDGCKMMISLLFEVLSFDYLPTKLHVV